MIASGLGRIGIATLLVVLQVAVMALQTTPVVAQAAPPPWREPLTPVRDTATITVGEDQLDVELSITGQQQSLGYGYRNDLPDGTGMLFVNDSAQPRTFWMKGMRFCLDIVWIEGGQITGAAESVCPDPAGTADENRARFSSGEPVTYVLEVPAGWLAARGYGPGTPVESPADVQAPLGG
jgi:uncharacterized membrane protein (UPF0127 family)